MKEDIREVVREKYAAAIKNTKAGFSGGCCSTTQGRSCCSGPDEEIRNIISGSLYESQEVEGLPNNVISFGCGNPTALTQLHYGEVVLDLGSGAGLDVLLSARRVGPFGKAYGLDMTDEMLAEARANQEKAGIHNVEFLKGYIEDIPLPDNTVDVIISNCVINLAADKEKVLKEAFRVLRPGGRFAVSDIVLTRQLPPKVQQDLASWTGCISGALLEKEYIEQLTAAGFVDVEIQPTRVYDLTDPYAAHVLPDLTAEELKELNGSIQSAFIRAKKPPIVLEAGRDYSIRKAVEKNFSEIKEVLEGSGLTTTGFDSNHFWVAISNEKVVGTIGLTKEGNHGLLRSLTVKPEFRKAGVGATLVRTCLREAEQSNVAEVYLLTNAADQYFKAQGFEVIDRQQIPGGLLKKTGLDKVCPESSTCMKLKLK